MMEERNRTGSVFCFEYCFFLSLVLFSAFSFLFALLHTVTTQSHWKTRKVVDK